MHPLRHGVLQDTLQMTTSTIRIKDKHLWGKEKKTLQKSQ